MPLKKNSEIHKRFYFTSEWGVPNLRLRAHFTKNSDLGMILLHLIPKVVTENGNYDIGHHHMLTVILCHTGKTALPPD